MFHDVSQNAAFVAIVGAVVTIGFAWDRMKDATKRRLVIDRQGFVIEGRPVPWEAIMSMQWVPAGGEHGEYLEIFVRNAGGYRAPRSGQVFVDHGAFGMRPNTLIDLLETAALPRRIPVLAIEPPPARGR